MALREGNDDKKCVLTGVKIQSRHFQLYKRRFTCLWTTGYSMDKLQEADTGEQPELSPRKEGVGILPGAFPWAAQLPTDSKIGLCL